MSSAFIPKEKQSAYQRWELNSFDAPEANPIHQVKERRAANEALLRAAREDAHREGFDAGYKSGAAEAAAQAALFARMVDDCGALARAQDDSTAQDILSLACAIARRVIGATLACNAEAVLPVIRDALSRVAHARAPGQLAIHPDDAPLVRARLGEQLALGGWNVVEDATLSRGGCRVECAAGDIDATLEQRWDRLMETLGQPGNWIVSNAP